MREPKRTSSRIRPYECPTLPPDGVHRYLWRRCDDRGRIVVNIARLAEAFGVSYDLTNDVLLAMRSEGRCRRVRPRPDNQWIYHVVDPSHWDPANPDTHARRASTASWG